MSSNHAAKRKVEAADMRYPECQLPMTNGIKKEKFSR